MAKHITRHLLWVPLFMSIGMCWHLNADCQMGKWCAALMLWVMAVMTNKMVASHFVQYRCLFISIFVLLGWCQVADVLSDSWRVSHLLWAMTLALSFIMGHRLNALYFQKTAFILTLLILISLVLPYTGWSLPISVQLFDNPAGEAAALVMGWICALPWLAGVCKRTRTKRGFGFKVIAILLLFLSITVFLYFRSRTGFLAILLATGAFLYSTYGRNIGKLRLSTLTSIGIVSLLGLIPLLYSRNVASADGRLLTYRTMWSLCQQHPLCGWGSQAMEAHYMAAQASTLQTIGEHSEYAWLASDVVRPFNELLAWCMEYGEIGVCLVSFVVWMMWKSCRKEHRAWMAALYIGWGLLGCFSYPSYYPYVSLLTLLALGICTEDKEINLNHTSASSHPLRPYRLSICALGGIGILLSALSIRHELRKEQWMEMASMDEEQAVKAYPRYQKDLHVDTDVGYAYAAALNFCGHPCESLNVLQSLQGRLQNYDTELLAGDDELSLGHWASAQKHFETAHHMVPIRFMPLYGLMQMHLGEGNVSQALSVARHILCKPVKVPSEDVRFVKEEAIKLLDMHK